MIFIHPSHEILIETEFGVPTMFKLLPFCFTILFSILAILIAEFIPEFVIGFKFSRLGYNIFGFFSQRFLIDYFYNKFIVKLILNLGGQTSSVLDNGSIELIGPYGLEKGLIKLSKNIVSLSTGVVTNYALYILIGLISYTFILFNTDLVLEVSSLMVIIIAAASILIYINEEDKSYIIEDKTIPSFTVSGLLSVRGKSDINKKRNFTC